MIPKPDKEIRQKQAINQGREGGRRKTGRQEERKWQTNFLDEHRYKISEQNNFKLNSRKC